MAGRTGSDMPFSGERRTAAHSAAQRAAVIITLLGEEAARPIVEKLDDVALAKVSAAIEDISRLSREDLAEIVVEFVGILRNAPGGLASGRAEARELVSRTVIARRSEAGIADGIEPGQGGPDPGAGVWKRLEQRPADQIGLYLNQLSPSLISLVIRKLNPALSSEVLCHIDEQKLLPVMGFMVEAAASDPGIDAIVARMVDIEFLTREDETTGEDGQHLESLGEILSLIPAGKRDSLIAFLKDHHEGKLQGIQKSLFTIEGLPQMLPRAAVPIAFREIDSTTTVRLMATIQEHHPDVAEFLLANVSSRLASQIRDDLKQLSPIPEREADILQRDFLSSLMTLKRSGAIILA